MLPILQSGGKKLNETTAALGKQSGMTKDAAKTALQYVQYQREWEATQMQLKVSIGLALMPVISELSKALMPLISAFRHRDATLGCIPVCDHCTHRRARGVRGCADSGECRVCMDTRGDRCRRHCTSHAVSKVCVVP